MSLAPEYLLQTTIVRGIQNLRRDTRLIAQLFRNLDQKVVGQLTTFIKTQAFDLSINYPRTALKVPAVVILLRDSREEQAFLGDSMGIEMPDDFSWEGPVDGLLGGVASTATQEGNPTRAFGPYFAAGGTENTLRIGTRQWSNDQFLVEPHHVRILQGTGVGQVRPIVGNGGSVMMIDGAWLTIPDPTTVFDVVRDVEIGVATGEPSTLYDRNNEPELLERKGGLYDLQYQLQVFAPNPDMAVYLTAMLKGIFTSFRQFLEGQGVINLAMRETDFTPKPEYQPDFSYLRMMTCEFIAPFDTYESFGPRIRSIRTVLEGQQPDLSIESVPVLSDTTFNIDAGGNDVIPGRVTDDLLDANRIYFGVADQPIGIDANFIQNTIVNAGGSMLSGKRQHVVNYQSLGSQYMWLAMPTRFRVNPGNWLDTQTNLPIGSSLVAQLNLTTAYGTELYDVLRSDTQGLGFIASEVT